MKANGDRVSRYLSFDNAALWKDSRVVIMAAENDIITGRVRGKVLVPESSAMRQAFAGAAERYVAELDLVPPLSVEELRHHAAEIVRRVQTDAAYEDFAAVLCGNALWRDTVAAVPFERRVLLLPQCLRKPKVCRAEMDDFGLLCAECGACPIGQLQAEAEELGYVVLVAEGTTVVTRLLDSGKVDAVVGVSCLSALERSFPHMVAGAIPGIAVPLVRDGCCETGVDTEWVRRVIRLRTEGPAHLRLDIENVRTDVRSWFEEDALQGLLQGGRSETEALALSWLSGGGKRWRPLLATCAYEALTGDQRTYPDLLRKLAVAVECFHKASLVHDDIEDDDDLRYGVETLHCEHGVPVALNVGDLLLGQGYRLIAVCGAAHERVTHMLEIAARGHETLCIGQGRELAWMRNPRAISSREVLDIFCRKTAPAFEVALCVGAVAGGADEEICSVLRCFSSALGTAYQIKDDLDDFTEGDTSGDLLACRPTLPLALSYEVAGEVCREARDAMSWWQPGSAAERRQIVALARELRIEEKMRQLQEHYKNQAVRCLSPIKHAPLKALLRRLVVRILGA